MPQPWPMYSTTGPRLAASTFASNAAFSARLSRRSKTPLSPSCSSP